MGVCLFVCLLHKQTVFERITAHYSPSPHRFRATAVTRRAAAHPASAPPSPPTGGDVSAPGRSTRRADTQVGDTPRCARRDRWRIKFGGKKAKIESCHGRLPGLWMCITAVTTCNKSPPPPPPPPPLPTSIDASFSSSQPSAASSPHRRPESPVSGTEHKDASARPTRRFWLKVLFFPRAARSRKVTQKVEPAWFLCACHQMHWKARGKRQTDSYWPTRIFKLERFEFRQNSCILLFKKKKVFS